MLTPARIEYDGSTEGVLAEQPILSIASSPLTPAKTLKVATHKGKKNLPETFLKIFQTPEQQSLKLSRCLQLMVSCGEAASLADSTL